MALYILVARASCSLPEIMTVWLVLWGAAVLPIGLAGTYWHVGSSCQGTRKNWKNPVCSLVISTIDVLLASQVRSSGITQLFPCNTSNERKVSIFSLERQPFVSKGLITPGPSYLRKRGAVLILAAGLSTLFSNLFAVQSNLGLLTPGNPWAFLVLLRPSMTIQVGDQSKCSTQLDCSERGGCQVWV